MEELQNNKPDDDGHRHKRLRYVRSQVTLGFFFGRPVSLTCLQADAEEDNDEQMSEESGGEDTGDSCSEEGHDGGYDDGSDSEMETMYQR